MDNQNKNPLLNVMCELEELKRGIEEDRKRVSEMKAELCSLVEKNNETIRFYDEVEEKLLALLSNNKS